MRPNDHSVSVPNPLIFRLLRYLTIPKPFTFQQTQKFQNSLNVTIFNISFPQQHIHKVMEWPNGHSKMITQFLKKVISNNSEHKDWPHKIPELQTILNSTTSSSRNYSPFFLTFLKHLNFPFQELLHAKPYYSDDSM